MLGPITAQASQCSFKCILGPNEFEREMRARHVLATPGALDGTVVKVYGWHVPETETFSEGDISNEKQFSEKFSYFPYALVLERGTTSVWLAIGEFLFFVFVFCF